MVQIMRGRQAASSPGPVTIVVVSVSPDPWYAWLGLRLLSRTEAAVRTGVAFWGEVCGGCAGEAGISSLSL